MTRLSKKHQRQFWKCIDKWQKVLGLSDWDITKVTEASCDDDDSTLADVASFPDYKSACLTLYENWADTPTDLNHLQGTAIHELLHIALSELMELAETREVTKKQLRDAEHKVIRALVRAFLPRRTKVG